MLNGFVSNVLQFVHGAFVLDIAGIQRGGGLEQQEPAFLVRHGTVFDSAWNDDKLALFDPFMVVAKFHPEAAFDHQEHFVFVLVVVEDELAFELVKLHGLAIEFGGYVGLPVFGDLGEFLGEIDFGHGILWIVAWYALNWMMCFAWRSQKSWLPAQRAAAKAKQPPALADG
jgi:hypothetical protein